MSDNAKREFRDVCQAARRQRDKWIAEAEATIAQLRDLDGDELLWAMRDRGFTITIHADDPEFPAASRAAASIFGFSAAEVRGVSLWPSEEQFGAWIFQAATNRICIERRMYTSQLEAVWR